MKVFLFRAGFGLLILPLIIAALPARADSMNSGRLGTVPYVLPKGQPSDVAILFADDPRSRSTADAVARLTGLGVAVATVDARAYLATLQKDKGECVWLSSDVEELNRTLQRKLAFPAFRLPVLVSTGSGGALVYGLLAEAPSYSFAGGVSLDFTPTLAASVDICGVGKPAAGGILPVVDVKQPWKIVPRAPADDASDWADSIDRAELVEQDPSGTAAGTLGALAAPLVDGAVNRDPNSLEDLPLIEMPTDKPAPYVAVILSGDGGWRDLDRSLGQLLADHGVPVVGVDSLLYFWQPKRPEEVADDLDRILDHYRRTWKIDRFVLVGFSFGADILPFAFNRMSDENKARVAEVSLLALSRNTRFEISVSEYFSDAADAETHPVAPELAKIPPKLVQCFYGVDEGADSTCTTPAAVRDEVIETAGGHHFGDDYEALADRIMQGATKRLK